MKIVLDFRKYDGVVGGVEQGVIQIVKTGCPKGLEVVLICKRKSLAMVEELFGEIHGLKIIPLDVESHAISAANSRLDSGEIQDIAVREGADLIHFFYNWSFPKNKKVPSILTVHDVIPFTFREAMALWRNLFLYKPSMKKACALNDLIVTVSEFSRQDIAGKLGVPLDKIKVVYNGLRTPAAFDKKIYADLVDRFGLQDGFIYNAGGIHERKNIPRLVQSFARLIHDEGYKGKLLISGSASGAPYQEKMRKVCDASIFEAGMDEKVIFTGFVTDDELDMLVAKADVFVYPSMYEGFGIPIIEAMQLGTPVVTSNVTAMPEVAGDAALLADPTDVAEMASQMSRLLNDQVLRNELIAKGKERAKGFSWHRNYDEYMAVYESVLDK